MDTSIRLRKRQESVFNYALITFLLYKVAMMQD